MKKENIMDAINALMDIILPGTEKVAQTTKIALMEIQCMVLVIHATEIII